MGTDHCEAGAWFAQLNRLPSEFVDVIRHHHRPISAMQHRRLVALTAISDHMANHLQRGDETASYSLGTNAAIDVLEECGVPNVAGRLQGCLFGDDKRITEGISGNDRILRQVPEIKIPV